MDGPSKPEKKIKATFFLTPAGNMPVRDWILDLDIEDRKIIGGDIGAVEYNWPIGLPTCRPMGDGLFEVRCGLTGGRSARVLFYVDSRQEMVLLHAFIKKTQKTPEQDLDLARKNKRAHETAGGVGK